MKPAGETALETADALYAKRETIKPVAASIELLHEMLIRNTDRSNVYEVLWRLGRAYFFLGQEANSERLARMFFRDGVVVCQRAADDCPQFVAGNFWLGVNLGLLASLAQPISAVHLVFKARRSLNRAIQIDEKYHDAGPLRVLGRIEHKLPRWLGGGTTRARRHYERAIKIAPENTVTRIYFAELLTETGFKREAREQLQMVLTAAPDPDWEFEIKRDQKLAKELINRL